MLTLGAGEIAVIFVLALVLFGPKKLPELGRTIGKAMTEFRRASNDLKATFEREMNTLERETKDIQVATRQTAKELSDHVSYDLSPSEHVWNALEEAVNDTAPPQETPATVGASEVSGAELTGETAAVSPSETTETPTEANPEVAGLEGTVPRGASQPQAEESEPEKPVNS